MMKNIMKNLKSRTSNKHFTVGIDYSITSPAIAIHIGQEWSFNNCSFYFRTTKKKYVGISSRVVFGTLEEDYITMEERYYNITQWVRTSLKSQILECNFSNTDIFIEGYSFGSRGNVFDIGENTGVLKHHLWKDGHNVKIFSPSEIKKFATGKGNSDKMKMSEAFKAETSFDMEKHLLCSEGKSPASDIIDAYFIAKLGFYTKLHENTT